MNVLAEVLWSLGVAGASSVLTIFLLTWNVQPQRYRCPGQDCDAAGEGPCKGMSRQ